MYLYLNMIIKYTRDAIIFFRRRRAREARSYAHARGSILPTIRDNPVLIDRSSRLDDHRQ